MAYNYAIDEMRDEEYPMMIDKVYLDHGGTTIYARSLIESFSEKMITNLYGNPHSASDPAKLSGEAVDVIREKALLFFKADPENFDLVFTQNATAAIKLVAESFRDLALTSSVTESFWYGYHKDAHTSIVGIREYTNGNHHCFASDREVDEWLGGYPTHVKSPNDGTLPGLFAYPGQSNMTGRRLPLEWTADLRHSTKAHHQNTYSLLDAAALATTTQLDLSDPETAPDFTALSFYKIFGFPDLGALIVRKKSGHILNWRKYFGGGTVSMVTVFHEATYNRRDGALHEGLEDGTLPFHSIVALGCAMETHKMLYGSMKRISSHTSFLGHRLYTQLSSLCHANGRRVVVIYTDHDHADPYADPTTQGSTVAFNLVRANGTPIPHSQVEHKANSQGIFLRSGGLCNAGGIASHLKIEPWQFKRAWSGGHRCGESGETEVISGKPTGVVRASMGAMSTSKDVDSLTTFLLETFVDNTNEEYPEFQRFDQQSRLQSRNEDHQDRSNNGSLDPQFQTRLPSRNNAFSDHGQNVSLDYPLQTRPSRTNGFSDHGQNSSYDSQSQARLPSRKGGFQDPDQNGSLTSNFQTRLQQRNGGIQGHDKSSSYSSNDGLIISRPSPIFPRTDHYTERPSGKYQERPSVGGYSARGPESFDYDADGRIAPQPPGISRSMTTDLSSTSKLPQPTLRTKKSLFSMATLRRSNDTSRAPASSRTGISDISGSTLATEHSELADKAMRNLVLVEDQSEDKKSAKFGERFWAPTKMH